MLLSNKKRSFSNTELVPNKHWFDNQSSINMAKFTHVVTRSRYAKRADIRKLLLRIDLAFKNKCTNDCDPITLENFSVSNKKIILISPTGHKYGFDANALLNYVIVSGQFRNPITRNPLNKIEINRLATVCDFRGNIHEYARETIPMHDDGVLEIIFGDLTGRIDNLIDACNEQISNDESFQIIGASLGEIYDIYDSLVRFAGFDIASTKVVEFLQRIQEIIRRGNRWFNLSALAMIHDVILNNVVYASNCQTNGAHFIRNGNHGNTDL